jgi:hypothetical protein
MNGRAADAVEDIRSVSDGARGFVRGPSPKLPGLLLLYGFAYAFFHIMPAFLSTPVWNRLMIADLLDLLTPFVMVGLVCWLWVVLRRTAGEARCVRPPVLSSAILLVGAVVFVEGHGMHLSANAIARHLGPAKDPGAYPLTYFFDEVLGHILWDSGIALLSIGLVLLGWRSARRPVSGTGSSVTALGALFYGFTYFVNAVEGQTVVFTLPLAVGIPLATAVVASRRRVSLLRNPVLWFFTVAYAAAVCLFAYWLIRQGGFPQFSELGWI